MQEQSVCVWSQLGYLERRFWQHLFPLRPHYAGGEGDGIARALLFTSQMGTQSPLHPCIHRWYLKGAIFANAPGSCAYKHSTKAKQITTLSRVQSTPLIWRICVLFFIRKHTIMQSITLWYWLSDLGWHQSFCLKDKRNGSHGDEVEGIWGGLENSR